MAAAGAAGCCDAGAAGVVALAAGARELGDAVGVATLVSFGGALMVLGGALLAWSAALLPTGVRIGLGLFGVWSVAFGAVLISAWSL